VTEPNQELSDLLEEIYLGQERVSRAEIYRRAVAAELPAELLIRLDAMPDGEYAQDEAAEFLDGQAIHERS